MFTKFLIAAVMASLVSLANGFLADQSLSFPANATDWGQLAILFSGIMVAVLLTSQSEPHGYDEEDDEEEDVFAPEDFEVGTVKWFNTKKGYGFITRDQGEDIFVHFRNIKGQGRRSLSDGERVSFVVTHGDKGLQADQVSAA